ncbi:MAG: methyltransferase domain-containing protein [bacterium]|nr:methyltransferase domain-containing protein [bacterium]
MYSISKLEIKLLNELKNLVLKNSSSTEEIVKKCDEISPLIDDFYFPYIYSATLCAAEGFITKANSLYDLCPDDNTFVKVFRTYLNENDSLTPKVKVFEDNTPYTAWNKSNFGMKYIENTVNNVADFFLKTFGCDKKNLTILDIGTGNGILLTKIVNNIISKTTVNNINLILLDMSENMLQTARKYCMNNIKGNVTITELCCKIDKISNKDITIIKECEHIDFIICATTIHHFPCKEKIEVLKFLRSFSKYCIISEVNFNHDLPEKYSPELIYAVSKNMNILFSDILNSDLTDIEKKKATEQFLLTESINIVTKEKSKRIDYHTKIRNWKYIVEEAGFKVISITQNAKYDDRIVYFSMILN